MTRWCLLVFVIGCGEGLPVLDVSDAAIDVDAGPFAPGAHGDFPQAIALDGGVMTPNVVPIFFANDVLQSGIQTFLAQLPTSTYWSALESEYGVGPLNISAPIVLAESPPQTATSDDVALFVASKLEGDPSWPTPPDNNIYFLYYPSTTTLTLDGYPSCSTFEGYHFYGQTSANARFVFAVQARCDENGQPGSLDSATAITSHEIVEAATDPFLTTYGLVDPLHIVWALYPGGELGDMCELESLSYQRLVGASVEARFWSNAAATAGHDPCAPAITTPYFNAVPLLPDLVTINLGQDIVTKGVAVPLGTSTTIDVQLFSDAPTSDWYLEADDTTSFTGTAASELTFAWDDTRGNNGDTRKLTITRIKNGAMGGTEFVIHSMYSQTRWHEYFAVAGN